MSVIKAAILGFGTVGEGVYRTIKTHQRELKSALGAEVEIVAVLIQDKLKQREIDEDVLIITNFEDILALPDVDVVFDAIVGREPGFHYLKKALLKRCHVVTANKEMFAAYGRELLALADQQGIRIGYEAAVAGGIPIIQTLQNLLNVNNVRGIQGILNGTSNFILTEMREKRLPFDEALAKAQEAGFAEADPENDIHGWDASFKLRILSETVFGKQPEPASFLIDGIAGITLEQVEAAERLGLRFKHLASVKQEDGHLVAAVQPVLLSPEHPFYHVEGVENAVNLSTDLAGSLTLQGPGAGMLPTASAMVEDFVQIWRQPVLKAGFRKTSGFSTVGQQSEPPRYWFVSNIQQQSPVEEIDYYEKITENIQVIRASEAQLNKLREHERQVAVYPILTGPSSGQIERKKEFV